MLGQLVLPPVLVEVGHLEAAEVEGEALAGQQALAPGVPVAEADEVQVVELGPHQLVGEGGLGLLGDVERQLVRLVVGLGQLAPQPRVELVVGELAVQERVDRLGVLDRRQVRLVLPLQDLLADQRADDLAAVLLELAGRHVGLEHVVLGAAVVPGHLVGPLGAALERVGDLLRHVGGAVGRLRELDAAEADLGSDAERLGGGSELGDEAEDGGRELHDRGRRPEGVGGREEDVQLGVLVLVQRQGLPQLAPEDVDDDLPGELHQAADRGLLAVVLPLDGPAVEADELGVGRLERLLGQLVAQEVDGLQARDLAAGGTEDALEVRVALERGRPAGHERVGGGLGLLPLQEAHVARQLEDAHLVGVAQRRRASRRPPSRRRRARRRPAR